MIERFIFVDLYLLFLSFIIANGEIEDKSKINKIALFLFLLLYLAMSFIFWDIAWVVNL